MAALLKAVGTMLGVHIQYAQREAADDMGRVALGVALLLAAMLLVFVAVLVGQAGLVLYLSRAAPGLGYMGAAFAVAAGDLGLATLLALAARSRLRRPILQQTRTLVRQTVSSITEL